MRKFIVAIAIILALPTDGMACTILRPPDPRDPTLIQQFKERLDESSIVVLARPLKIRRIGLPYGSNLSSKEPHEQVVEWRVLYSWKGSRPGDVFETKRKIDPADLCVGWDTISDYDSRLVFGYGHPPFARYTSEAILAAEWDLIYLQDFYNPTQPL